MGNMVTLMLIDLINTRNIDNARFAKRSIRRNALYPGSLRAWIARSHQSVKLEEYLYMNGFCNLHSLRSATPALFPNPPNYAIINPSKPGERELFGI